MLVEKSNETYRYVLMHFIERLLCMLRVTDIQDGSWEYGDQLKYGPLCFSLQISSYLALSLMTSECCLSSLAVLFDGQRKHVKPMLLLNWLIYFLLDNFFVINTCCAKLMPSKLFQYKFKT